MLVLAATGPAFAQFGNIFGPPRPPADVPRQQDPFGPEPPRQDRGRDDRPPGFDPWRQQRGPEPPPPPLTRLPPPGGESGRSDTGRGAAGRRDLGVESEPLPPPPGAAGTAPAEAGRPPLTGPGQPPLVGLPPGQRQPRGTPQPGMTPGTAPGTAPADRDAVVTLPPKQRIVNPTAVFAGLDKITARIISFDVAIGETVQFGALRLTPRACYTRPPTELPSTDGFVEVDEITLKGEVKRIFTGWMFAASPGLHAIEHPIYDVWLTDCRQQSPQVAGVQSGAADGAAAADPPEAAPPSSGRVPTGPVPYPPVVPR